MMIHSTHNNLDGTVCVLVEGIDGVRDEELIQFARGAAGHLNPGSEITGGSVRYYTDDVGRVIPEGDDTSDALGAAVVCDVEEERS